MVINIAEDKMTLSENIFKRNVIKLNLVIKAIKLMKTRPRVMQKIRPFNIKLERNEKVQKNLKK